MGRFAIMVMVLLVLLSILSAQKIVESNKENKIISENEIFVSKLQEPHNLINLMSLSEALREKNVSYYFLPNSSGEITMILFAWEGNNGSRPFAILPESKIRVEVVGQVERPTVQFFLNSSISYSDSSLKQLYFSDKEKFFGRHLDYALIVCSAEDYPKIND